MIATESIIAQPSIARRRVGSLPPSIARARAGNLHRWTDATIRSPVRFRSSTGQSLNKTLHQTHSAVTASQPKNQSNQQYSIIALTDAAGTIVERTTYTAYGAPTFLDASASPLTPPASSLDNRYTYTGREWDSTLHLHHFRARMMDPQLGRFCSKDPIGYQLSEFNLYQYVRSRPLRWTDPSGLDPINFEFNAFIHGARGSWLQEPAPGIPSWPWEFKTDERGFGIVETSRLSTKGGIESCAIGLGKPFSSSSVGASHRRQRILSQGCVSGALPPEHCYRYSRPRTAALDVDWSKGSFSKPPCISKISFGAGAAYPYIPAAPQINYEITVTFEVVGADRVRVEVKGIHDDFPDYEAIVVVGGRRDILYKRMSPHAGPSPTNLGWNRTTVFRQWTYSVPTPACCKPGGSCGK